MRKYNDIISFGLFLNKWELLRSFLFIFIDVVNTVQHFLLPISQLKFNY